MSRVAIVAALEREVFPLVREWRRVEHEQGGRRFRCFENGEMVLVCGGIGAAAARRAAEALIALYAPGIVYSVGFAGALEPAIRVGDLIEPRRVINASDGSSVVLESGDGELVSFAAVASQEQKGKLRESYGAQAVDMEAAAVAQAAQARGVAFGAVKAISDEFDFEFPAMERFVDSNGRFLTGQFAMFAAMRPWLWPRLIRLARDSNRAARALCNRLLKMGDERISGLRDMEAVNRR